MEKAISKLTVFFDDPFWVGICEREFNGKYEACKITFGAEPKDYEVHDFLLKNCNKLQFSPSIDTVTIKEGCMNPKRLQREINKQLQNTGAGTKAQKALKLLHEQGKMERKSYSRQQKEAEKERQFQLRQDKHKEKHRGH